MIGCTQNWGVIKLQQWSNEMDVYMWDVVVVVRQLDQWSDDYIMIPQPVKYPDSSISPAEPLRSLYADL